MTHNRKKPAPHRAQKSRPGQASGVDQSRPPRKGGGQPPPPDRAAPRHGRPGPRAERGSSAERPSSASSDRGAPRHSDRGGARHEQRPRHEVRPGSNARERSNERAHERPSRGRAPRDTSRERELRGAGRPAPRQPDVTATRNFAPQRAEPPAADAPPESRRPAPFRYREPLPFQAPEDDDFDDGDVSDVEAPELGIGARVIPPHVRFEPDPGVAQPSTPLPSSAPPRDVEAQIRALEARLDSLIRRSAVADEGEASADESSESSATRARSASEPPATDSATEYVERQWSREALRNRLEDVDDFGLDPSFENKVRAGLDLLYRRYFRVEVDGIDNIPSSGRAVAVANHSGALPLDGMMLRAAMRLDHPSARDLRWLAEDFVFHLPFAGVFLNRIGAVRACPENAERLLEKDSLIAVFPEGVHGIKKLFSERYRLQRFGRGGYIRLCLRMRAPLIPCAIIGAEETNPLIYRFEWLAELLRLPYLPVTPTFPLLGPFGLLPAPTRWKIRFGEPIGFDSYGPEAADDDVLVGRLSERVRSSIQGLLDSGLRTRKSVWFG